MTEVDNCCKEIVGIDLPECCLGTEFNLLTAAEYYEGVQDVAGASRVTASRALAISHTPKKPHTPADPPPADPADEQAPAPAASALAGVSGRAGARASGVPTQGRGQFRAKEESVRAAVANKSCCA